MNSQDRSPRSARAYHHQIEEALNDSFQRRTLDKFAVEYRASRDTVFEEVDGRELIRRIADVKDVAAQHIEELGCIGYLEVKVLRVNALAGEFLRKETSAETVSQRETYDAVFVHFSAIYIVLMPNVKRFHCTSAKPTLCKMPSICSACGKASIEAGK